VSCELLSWGCSPACVTRFSLWELLTAEEPYQDMPLMQARSTLSLYPIVFSPSLLRQVVVSVVRDGMRPPIPESHANSSYATLMRDCWNEEPPNRPSFDDICNRLEVMLADLEEKECVWLTIVIFFHRLPNLVSPSTPPSCLHRAVLPSFANPRVATRCRWQLPTFLWSQVYLHLDELIAAMHVSLFNIYVYKFCQLFGMGSNLGWPQIAMRLS
jgi:hypothetical protein